MKKLQSRSSIHRLDLVRANFQAEEVELYFRSRVDARVQALQDQLDAQNAEALVRLQAAAKEAHLLHVQQAREAAKAALVAAERAEQDATALADAAEAQS